MARFLSPADVSQIRGQVGGLVARVDRGRQVLSSAPNRVQSSSDRSTAVHGRFLSVVSSWRTLSDSLRDGYARAALRLREQSGSKLYAHGCGFSLYTSTQLAAYEAGFALPTVAPTGWPPRPCWFVHGSASIGGSTLLIEPQRGTASGSRLVAYWSDVLYGGRESVHNARYFIWSSALSTGAVNRWPAWSARFSPQLSSLGASSVAVRAHVVSAEGLMSPDAYDLITFAP